MSCCALSMFQDDEEVLYCQSCRGNYMSGNMIPVKREVKRNKHRAVARFYCPICSKEKHADIGVYFTVETARGSTKMKVADE